MEAHPLLVIAGVRPIFVDALGRDAVLYLEDGFVLVSDRRHRVRTQTRVDKSRAFCARSSPAI